LAEPRCGHARSVAPLRSAQREAEAEARAELASNRPFPTVSDASAGAAERAEHLPAAHEGAETDATADTWPNHRHFVGPDDHRAAPADAEADARAEARTCDEPNN
jgi:hypothetical protein